MLRKLLLGLSLAIGVFPCSAQVATGLYNYGSFDSFGFDSIDRGSLNVHFSIPIVNKAGRGLAFQYSLEYDGLVWTPAGTVGSQVWNPDASFGLHGYLLNDGYKGYLSYSSNNTKCFDSSNPGSWYWAPIISGFVYHDAFGVNHSFKYSNNTCKDTITGDGSSGDGSGFQLSGYTVTTRSGIALSLPVYLNGAVSTTNGTITDTNGNQVSNNQNGTFTDTTGTTPLTITGSGTAASAKVFTYLTYGTTPPSASVTLSYKTYTVQTKFGCSVGEFNKPVDLPDQIKLANGSLYQFNYEPTPGSGSNVTGRLASITLPTGGKISYQYTGGSNGINCADGTPTGVTRTTSDGNRTYIRSSITTATSHTDIADGSSRHSTYDFEIAGGYFYETARAVYPGAVSGTALLARNTCYNGAASPCTTTAITLPIAQIDTYETLDGVQKHGSTAKYNSWGLQTEQDTYDFGGASGRGSLLRKEVWVYPTTGIVTLVSSDTVTDGAGNKVSQRTYLYDQGGLATVPTLPQHAGAISQRGNLTNASAWVNTTATTITQTLLYDQAGQVVSSTDPNQHTTSYAYDPTTDTFLTTVTYPTPSSGVAITAGAQSDPNTGLLLSTTDPNKQITTYRSYDALLRPLEIDYPDGGQTLLSYPSATEMTASRLRQGSNYITSVYDSDTYGRQSKATLDDPEGNDVVSYSYDVNGNLFTATNPQRSSGPSLNGTTTYYYDALQRLTSQTQPDSTTQGLTYLGNTVTRTNEVGSQWKRTSDGLGRLTQLLEPSPTVKSPTIETDYTYNIFATTVNQKGVSGETPRVRTFTSDSLGRAITAVTPEAGTVCYGTWSGGAVGSGNCVNGYDANGNLITMTDARGKTLYWAYDTLNRVTSHTASDSSVSDSYSYDWSGNGSFGIGRVFGAFGQSSTGFYYDKMGRITGKSYSTPSLNGGWAQAFNAAYDLAGNLTSLTYPDGRVVTQGWDNAGNLNSVANGTYNYLSSATYYPGGAANTMTFGNGATQTFTGNSRLQPLEISLQANANGLNQKVMDKFFCYGPATPNCANYGLNNNGNIQGINDTLNTGRLQGFLYDNLNRLTAFGTGNQSISQGYAYDSFGNMNQNAGTYTTSLSFNTKNQISNTGFVYDAAGNLTQSNVGGVTEQLGYDAESKLINVNNGAATYVYDAETNRVRKNVGSNWTEYIYFNGQPLAEKDQTGNWTDYIFANGQRIAKTSSNLPLIHAHGVRDNTISMACGTVWQLSTAANINGYVIRSGDRFVFSQNETVAHAGPSLGFTDGTYTGSLRDQNGQSDGDSTQDDGLWHQRTVDLSSLAGKTVNGFYHATEADTPAGTWDVYYGNVSLVSTDGLVQQIFTGQPVTSSLWSACGGHNLLIDTEQTPVSDPATNTYYYHGDHLGSARMLTAGGGWPMSSDTFYPFGVEQSATTDANHYKYTGDERDQESFLDHATFRQLSYQQGRWTSPDPYSGSYDPGNPQSFNRYAYALNNPLSLFDPSGLMSCPIGPGGDCGGGGGGGGGDCGDLCDCDPLWYDCGGWGGPGYPGGPGGGSPGEPSSPNYGPPHLPPDYGDLGNGSFGESLGIPIGAPNPFGDLAASLGLALGLPTMGDIGCNPVCDATGKYHCDLFGVCYRGPALPPSCFSQAVSKNALTFGADALGAIPGEGQVLAGVQLAAAGVGFVNGLVTKDATGAVGSVIGGQLILVGASAEVLGSTALKAVPVAGNLLSAFFAIRDVANGFSDYQACLAGH